MDLLFLCHEFGDFGGGAGNAARAVATELVRSGHTVHCITSNINGRLAARETIDGVVVHRLRGWRRSALENRIIPTFLWFVVGGTVVGRRLQRQAPFDVIHAFFTVPAGLVGHGLASAFGLPLVVSLRGSDVPHYVPRRNPSPLFRQLARKVWQGADRVVALSDGLLAIARRTDPLAGAQVVHNGVDTRVFRPSSGRKADGDVLRLVCACRLVRHKGVDCLLRAVGLMDPAVPVSLDIVGDGPERQSLEQAADALGISDRVRFAGYVTHDRLAARYHYADLFVLPTHTESFGQVLTEAMACGLPVVASAVGGIPEIVRQGEQGWLVPAADEEALAKAIADAGAEGRRALAARGAANAAYVADRFSWQRVAQQYAEIYEEVLHDRGGSA